MSRTTARSAAMQMIFEKVSGGQGGEETLKMVYDELRENGVPGERAVGKKEPDEEDRAYISRAFNGVLEHLDELDDIIGKTAKGWTTDRMSLVDLTVLRLAGKCFRSGSAGTDRTVFGSGRQTFCERYPGDSRS